MPVMLVLFPDVSPPRVAFPDFPDEVYNSKIESEVSEHNHPSTEIVDVATRNDGKNSTRKEQDGGRANLFGRPDHQHTQAPEAGGYEQRKKELRFIHCVTR